MLLCLFHLLNPVSKPSLPLENVVNNSVKCSGNRVLQLVSLCLLLAFPHAASARSPATIKQLEERGKLNGLPQSVEFDAQVTYVDPVWSFVFLEDDSGAIFGHSRSSDLEAGDMVHVQGTLEPGDLEPVIHLDRVTVLDNKPLRAPTKINIGAAAFGDFDGHYVQLECVVRQILLGGQHASLICEEDGKAVYISISKWGLNIADVEHLLHRRIRCEGALGIRLDTEVERSAHATLETAGLNRPSSRGNSTLRLEYRSEPSAALPRQITI